MAQQAIGPPGRPSRRPTPLLHIPHPDRTLGQPPPPFPPSIQIWIGIIPVAPHEPPIPPARNPPTHPLRSSHSSSIWIGDPPPTIAPRAPTSVPVPDAASLRHRPPSRRDANAALPPTQATPTPASPTHHRTPLPPSSSSPVPRRRAPPSPLSTSTGSW